ncbi:hypothetical protein [Butyrivibrio hungatei]|uniref:Uncharacterized protein n=1 Tax=Butyrivibrio hungatei TaxID=185008 RepID=A0A1D9P6B8_9FIRM|nr:hypothetical protein [Butyrivibrio hungatei]AOZ97854.1 hypothetical protein bhn_II055 [Butyrivibrio hungatei]
MKRFSLELLNEQLKASKDAEYVTDTPEGVNPDMFEKFLRILKAESSEEIADITDDEVISILCDCNKFFDVLVFDTIFNESKMRQLAALKSVASARRIL